MSAKHYVTKVLAKMTTTWPFPTMQEQGFVPVDYFDPRELGINITHCMGYKGKGGVTLAWRKTSDMRNCRMIEVAVAYCAPADTFTKKIGTANALRNFEVGMTVLVPARTNNDDLSIPINLRNMFWYSLDI